jgi:betaine-aldehyde dehydrogenase
VPKTREAEVLEAIAALVDSMPVGDPNDPNTYIGPMVSARQRDRVEAYIGVGIKEGARLVRGGLGRPSGLNHGWFVRPTLFAGVDQNARIAQEEIFGPVLAVSTYETEAEALAIANNSDFGLSGAVFSRDLERAVNFAAKIRTGVVEVNGAGTGPYAPFGGVKQSGLGREGGHEGFDPYVEIQAIGVPRSFATAQA